MASAAGSIEISDEYRWNVLQQRAQEWRIRKAFTLFRDHEIEPILIKGWSAGLHYPPTQHRASIDIDLAVDGESFAEAVDLADRAAGEGLAIDVHNELRHLDTVPWGDLVANSRLLEIKGYPVRVLRDEDHLRVLCVHWLTDGGSSKERLWDVYHFIEGRRDDFEWERFLETVSTRRRRWLLCTLGLTERYLGLDLGQTPVADEARRLPSWLIRAVEEEWSGRSRHVPLEVALFRPSTLAQQISRRLFPNPLWATIEMEGDLDARTRFFYQIGSILKRIPPSFRRIASNIRQRIK